MNTTMPRFGWINAIVAVAAILGHGWLVCGFVPVTNQNPIRQALMATIDDTSVVSTRTRSCGEDRLKVVLVAGFESFNRDLYNMAASELGDAVDLTVFADSDLRSTITSDPEDLGTNPEFERAMQDADAFVGSLVFDYDDVAVVKSLLPSVKGPRLLFECATELMEFNQVGSFNMMKKDGDDASTGPPQAVKAILSKFSGNEEDKLAGYIKLLKTAPDMLAAVDKVVKNDKLRGLKSWLEAYRFWNQGGKSNVSAMLQVILDVINNDERELPQLIVTPDVGLLHPLLGKGSQYLESPAEYLAWRLSKSTQTLAKSAGFQLADNKKAPRVAILLYRKHVLTEQPYILQLITMMEAQGVLPVPVFINGVEAHTIVRDLLTSHREVASVSRGDIKRPSTYQAKKAVTVDAIVNTVGFPLVGGPSGSMEAGRNVDVAEALLRAMDVPYIVASPLLLQSIEQWKRNGVLGLQSVVLYGLPELDGAIDTVVLGGLVGDHIALVPERVRKLTSRIKSWVNLRRTPPSERRIAMALYGFPPNVGAVGTAALLDVPKSLEAILEGLHKEGYEIGEWMNDPDASGESLVAALAILCQDAVVSAGAGRANDALQAKMQRAREGDVSVAATLAREGGGLGGAAVRAIDVTIEETEQMLGKYMSRKVARQWSEKDPGPGATGLGKSFVSGLQIGNVFLFVQPLLGVVGDPMRLLFERDLTPHYQYISTYLKLQQPEEDGGFGIDGLVHVGMHGTSEWLPGKPLGNDRQSWSDVLLGQLPNLYIYAANNPSESILAKRRGYATLISHNVPPYGRSGLYLELANLKELVDDYRSAFVDGYGMDKDLLESICALADRNGMLNDVPFPEDGTDETANEWVSNLNVYLNTVSERLYSSGLHAFGSMPTDKELDSYLEAYFGDRLTEEQRRNAISTWHSSAGQMRSGGRNLLEQAITFVQGEEFWAPKSGVTDQASHIVSLLSRSTEELHSLVNGLNGGYIEAKAGGDLLRDGADVLPTGRNIHSLDPYRMPSASAWKRGQRAAEEIIRQHLTANGGNYPETVAVTLWGLDAIKTKGESVAIVLALVGAEPVKEGTGRIVRYDLVPLEKLGRPRIDVLCSLSGIFRDSFANIVDLLDDVFERAASADEPVGQNYVRKHVQELEEDGVERAAARLFSNPPGDYGSNVNEVVTAGDWEESESLGETWKGRNAFSYGRREGNVATAGTSRPEVLDKLLKTTERVVQEVDSVEYGLSDIQEYYANTGALKKAAENLKDIDPTTGKQKRVALSVIEAFGTSGDDCPVEVKDVEEVLRLEYRSKLLNPKWRDAMLSQGSGGAYEISQRMTAMIGWSATAQVDNFVFDQACERYALDEDVAKQLQRSNPEAFKNVVRRLLEAAGRGMWETDNDTLEKLKELYDNVDDVVEQGTARTMTTLT